MGNETLSSYANLQEYELGRDAVLASIKNILMADARVGSAWLSGSFGRGEADAWADFDLHIAVADAHLREKLAEMPAFYQRVGRPLLVQEKMVADSMPDSTFNSCSFPTR